ncbi:hypothetical protein LCGC14_1110570 [marine sediment metagenome]|uniref:Uncharacterized protein n=1 Tax=marine sediment metagenome TaxID=412755 RepID=A0A0F9MBK3_9ZZZZ
MPEDRLYVPYAFRNPRMDQSVPPNQVRPGSFGRLSGIDGRFNGGLRKFYGMKEVLDLDDVTGMGDIDTYAGADFFKQVTFQKRNTSTVYRGFIIRWDSQNSTANQQIDLVYTADAGSTWTRLAVWAAGNGITASLEIDTMVSGGYLLIAVDTKATKTVYWDGAALSVVSSGPGDFDVELTTPTLNTSAVDTSYQLRGSGTYQIAYRFYDSTRGIYSSLSAPLIVHLDHFKTTKATGTISFSTAGGDSGLMVAGDVFTINSRTYEYIDSGSDVTIAAAAGATTAEHATALADAINGDSSADVTASAQASSVLLESIVRGTAGNAYGLSVVEVGPNTDDISVSGSTLTGGGVVTTEPETQVKITIDFPANTAVVAGEVYADFAALFDTVDIFRTIDLGNSITSPGAIFYLEQTIAKAGNWATSGAWDALTVDVGTLVDEALPFQIMYDPEKDIIASPPQSGTIGRYGGVTFMAQASSVDGGYDTLSSSPEHNSPEYFSTYNRRIGDPEDGRPLRFIPAGDSLFQLGYNAIIHIFKSGKLKPLQFSRLHKKRGIVGKEVAHSSGNSVFMITGLGLVILNATDGSMGSVTAVDRVIFDDWKSELSDVKSCYDALMNASFFLNSTRNEMLILWHTTKISTMLDGANFVGATSGPDITSGKNDRAFFITATGLIVSPDNLEAGSGTMWDLSDSYTLNGTATATSATTLTDANATLNADMVGSRLYMATGDNAGDSREIATINNSTKVFTFTSVFDNDIATGDTYAVSPLPFSQRAWPLQIQDLSKFNRWIMTGATMKSRKLSGFTDNPNNKWRVGAYRNGGTSIESTVAYPDVTSNPSDSAEVLNIEGIDLEPYIEQIASGVMFELTDAEFSVSITDSRKVN